MSDNGELQQFVPYLTEPAPWKNRILYPVLLGLFGAGMTLFIVYGVMPIWQGLALSVVVGAAAGVAQNRFVNSKPRRVSLRRTFTADLKQLLDHVQNCDICKRDAARDDDSVSDFWSALEEARDAEEATYADLDNPMALMTFSDLVLEAHREFELIDHEVQH